MHARVGQLAGRADGAERKRGDLPASRCRQLLCRPRDKFPECDAPALWSLPLFSLAGAPTNVFLARLVVLDPHRDDGRRRAQSYMSLRQQADREWPTRPALFRRASGQDRLCARERTCVQKRARLVGDKDRVLPPRTECFESKHRTRGLVATTWPGESQSNKHADCSLTMEPIRRKRSPGRISQEKPSLAFRCGEPGGDITMPVWVSPRFTLELERCPKAVSTARPPDRRRPLAAISNVVGLRPGAARPPSAPRPARRASCWPIRPERAAGRLPPRSATGRATVTGRAPSDPRRAVFLDDVVGRYNATVCEQRAAGSALAHQACADRQCVAPSAPIATR